MAQVPLQSTWLKRTTELSEELPPAQRRWLPARERLTVQGSPLGGLVRASGAEGRRLERAVDEEVHRTPRICGSLLTGLLEDPVHGGLAFVELPDRTPQHEGPARFLGLTCSSRCFADATLNP